LHRDGLSYDVQLNLPGDNPHVLITQADGENRAGRRQRRHVILPTLIPAQRCRERALEVAWFLPENREQRNNQTAYWRKRQERYQELAGLGEEELRAELEYWRELEALSGQRQHFKPGRTDETANSDDEVAA